VADVDVQPGQAFADLLFLAALSCQAPMAVVSVAQPDGSWSTLSYGVDRTEPLRDPELFAAVAAGREPVELSDALGDERLAGSPLSTGPLGVRYFYGIPLRGPGQAAVGLLGVLDRRARELSSREQQAIAAVARQLAGQLALRRRARKPLSGADDVDGSTGRRQPDETVGGSPAPSVGSGRHQHLLRSHEVALLFDVTGRTVVNWASSNKLASLRTAGGHLRFRSEDVLALLAAHPPDSVDEGSPPGP
jgi:excisionase family DNA binding protein